MVSEIRSAINRLLWDEKLRRCGEIVYVNRTSRGIELEVVKCDQVSDVSKDYFRVGSGVDAKYIPFHRVVEVRSAGGPLWKSRRWKVTV